MPAQPASDQPPGEPPVTGGRKLQPSAVPIWFLNDIGRGIFGFVPILFAGPAAVPFVAGLAMLMLIAPAVRYSRFRYEIQGNALIVQGGVLGRWRRVIPRERVQSVDLVQKLRHRAFGVVELRIEAVGGKQTEAALVALAPDEAERIRNWASGDHDQAAEETKEESPPLAKLSGRDLLIAGITGGRVAVLAALLGYAQEYLGENTFDEVSGFADRLLPGASLPAVVSVVAAVVITLSLLLSIALTIVIYWDFTVRMDEGRLIITRGLLEKRRAQVPLHRVQAIEVNENFVRRPFGLASLSVVVAGYSSEGQENQESTVLLPLAPRAKAWGIATQILGANPELASVALKLPPARSLLRKLIAPTILGLAAGIGGLLYLEGPVSAAPFALVPGSWLLAWLSWRCSGYALDPGFVLVRGGVLVRKTSIVPETNIQHLQLTRSIFQDRFRLATVRVHIPGTHRNASDLDQLEATRWFRLLGERVT